MYFKEIKLVLLSHLNRFLKWQIVKLLLIKLISQKQHLSVLTPNLKGVQKAIEKKAETVCVFVTASEAFSKNTNCTVSESLKVKK